ncbi:MAG: GreA/GreB family elongation factor, partial [Dissulfurimicrobium hydrothermale]
VRESAFYSNKVDALNGLWNALDKRDIYPQYVDVSKESSTYSFLRRKTKRPSKNPRESEPDRSIHGSEIDIKVEVEDTVVYVDIENPQDEKQALITYERSNPECGAININTPIARALLGKPLNSIVEAKLPKGTVSLRIKDIKKPV